MSKIMSIFKKWIKGPKTSVQIATINLRGCKKTEAIIRHYATFLLMPVYGYGHRIMIEICLGLMILMSKIIQNPARFPWYTPKINHGPRVYLSNVPTETCPCVASISDTRII